MTRPFSGRKASTDGIWLWYLRELARADGGASRLEPDIPDGPGAALPDKCGLSIDRLLGHLHQLTEQIGSPGPAIYGVRNGRVVGAVEGDFPERHELPAGQLKLPPGRVRRGFGAHAPVEDTWMEGRTR